jgi:hypothetical protein
MTVDYVKNYKNIQLKISDGSIITGKINILDHIRLSDYLRHSNYKFLTVFSEETEDNVKKATIVNMEYIIWAETWD